MKARLVVVLVCILVLGVGAHIASAGDQPGGGVAPDSFPLITTMGSAGGNVVTFRIDTHPELDFYQPCNGGDNLIAFPINVHGVDLASVKSVKLAMAVWDVDFDCGGWCCERDTVYINGHQLTTPMSFLTGANEQWSAVSFDVPPAWLVEGDNNIQIFIDTLCPNYWCVTCDWAELRLEVGATPEIEDIEVLERILLFYRELKFPVTTKEFYLRAKLKNMDGYEVVKVAWAGDCAPGEGHPYPVTFDGGEHGKKNVTATLTYKDTATGDTGTAPPKSKEFKLFFAKRALWGLVDADDDDDGDPNWFEYWKIDNAVPDMGSFAYNDKLPGYGRFSSPNTLELGPSAGNVHYAGGLTIGGITFGGAEGIDCTAEVCAHELYHKWVYDQNQGPWGSMTHSDSDRLPDTYETDVSGTIIDNPDTHDVAGIKGYPPYHDYGDQEWMAMRAGNGEVGYPLKDWAYPGKQTQTSTTPAATSSVATITPVFVGSAAQAAATTTTTGFTGVFSDEGTDTNSNSLYDSLTVGVGVSAEHAGYYNVVGWLEDGIGTEVGLVNQLVYLDAGVQTCNLSFYGVRIHEVGSDGPYVLSVILATEDGEQYDTSLAAYTTATYSVSQFEGHQVYFEGTVTDQAQDANQDGLYEELTFAVTVIATTPGTYHLTAFLVASDGAPIYPLTTSSTLTSGVHMMTLSAPGTVIRQSGADGPYRLQSLGLFDGDTRTDFKYLAHTTQPYAYTDFEAGAAEFGPSTSFTDAGVDLNANWFFDVLRVELPTFVSQDGRYALFGRLFDDQGNLICEAFSEMELTAGTNTLVLDFPGEEIRVSGKAGPYLVRYAFLYDAEGSVADSLPAPYLTAAYACTEFDTPPAALTRQFDDRSIDTNADGIYEFLEVDVGVFAASAGTCALNARLMDKNGGEIAWAATTAYVSAGQPQMLTLVFDGPPIYNHGVNGPYLVRDLLFYSVSDPSLFDYMDDPYLTQSAWLVAENRPPVADAGPDQVVDATGPTGALVTLDGSASTDPDSTSGTNDDIVSFEWLENASLVAIGMQAQLAMPIGTHTVTLRVTDSQGEQDEDTVQITVRSQTVSVVIDIKPGGYPNSINLGSRGVIPVAILSSEDFDATQVDPATAELAGAGVAVGGKGDKYLSHQEDVDGDGLIDLILQVRTENLDPGQFDGGYACITAYTYGGINVRGCDEITIVPPE